MFYFTVKYCIKHIFINHCQLRVVYFVVTVDTTFYCKNRYTSNISLIFRKRTVVHFQKGNICIRAYTSTKETIVSFDCGYKSKSVFLADLSVGTYIPVYADEQIFLQTMKIKLYNINSPFVQTIDSQSYCEASLVSMDHVTHETLLSVVRRWLSKMRALHTLVNILCCCCF